MTPDDRPEISFLANSLLPARTPTRRASIARLFIAGSGFIAALLQVIPASAQPAPPPPPSKPPVEYQYHVTLSGVSAIQLAWWFQHLADTDEDHWKALAPSTNRSIAWVVNPREDSHQIIGSNFVAEQRIGGAQFKDDVFKLRAQFADYVTQQRGYLPGQTQTLNPTLPLPASYTVPYPSPVSGVPGVNGFNENMVLGDGTGFEIGNIFWSWKNSGGDDTASASGPKAVDLIVTFHLNWMEDSNRPASLGQNNYFYSASQIAAIWAAWDPTISALGAHLPRWFGRATQDDIARNTGWTVTTVVDTGHARGLTSELQYWWWNHAMGDEPGDLYLFWCPPAHHEIRWLKGFSPAEVLGSQSLPRHAVVAGTIYPDIQHTGLQFDGGGMMAYPLSMAPIPGAYKHMALMYPVTKAQVDNFAQVRYPVPPRYLAHQWEDTPQGLIHRSSFISKLPLAAAVTQSDFYDEHQSLEGQFHSAGAVQKAFKVWSQRNPGHEHEYPGVFE